MYPNILKVLLQTPIASSCTPTFLTSMKQIIYIPSQSCCTPPFLPLLSARWLAKKHLTGRRVAPRVSQRGSGAATPPLADSLPALAARLLVSDPRLAASSPFAAALSTPTLQPLRGKSLYPNVSRPREAPRTRPNKTQYPNVSRSRKAPGE